jgi:electron transfer flavoprotein alpha/beta subunit
MNIPSNFSLDEILKTVELPLEVVTALEIAFEAERLKFQELEAEVNEQYTQIERLEEVQSNAENLVCELAKELKCKDFRYTETKNLVKKLTDLVENAHIEV